MTTNDDSGSKQAAAASPTDDVDRVDDRKYRKYEVKLRRALDETETEKVVNDASQSLEEADFLKFVVASISQKRSYYAVQVGLLTTYYLSIIIIILPCLLLFVLLPETPYYLTAAPEEWNTLRAILFVISGGLIGSILYNIRQLNRFYRQGAYNPRYLNKYITGPFEAAVMALVVLALIRGGSTLFVNVDSVNLQELNATNMLAFFGTGALVGFSMREVVGWLHDLAKMVFKPESDKLPGKK